MLKRIKLATVLLVAASVILPVASSARATFSKTAQEGVEIQGEIAKEELITRRRHRRRHRHRRRRGRRYYRRHRRIRRFRRPSLIGGRRCYRIRRYHKLYGYGYQTVCRRYRNYRRYRY